MKKNIENELPKIRVKLRDDKPLNSEGNYTLNYLILFGGNTIKKPTGLYIEEKEWNKKKETVLGSSSELLWIQRILEGKKILTKTVKRKAHMAVGLEDPEKYQVSQGFCFWVTTIYALLLRLYHLQFFKRLQ